MAETVATYTVPEHHVQMFTNNVEMSLRREAGDLVNWVSRNTYGGERSQVVNFLGPIEFIQRQTAYQDTKVTEPEHTQRWITADDYDVAVLIDRIDTLRMIYDPTSPYVAAFRDAAARKQDEVVMNAFFANAKVGKNGTQLASFPAQDTIANGGTGLTVAKLRATRKLLKKRHVSLRREQAYIAVTAEQKDNLLGETQVTSADYAAVKALVDGEVSRFMGFEFVEIEEIIPSYTSGGVLVRQCPVWVKSGMQYGDWQSLQITIGPRADKNNIKQIHGSMTMGATRLEEGKVLALECVEPLS